VRTLAAKSRPAKPGTSPSRAQRALDVATGSVSRRTICCRRGFPIQGRRRPYRYGRSRGGCSEENGPPSWSWLVEASCQSECFALDAAIESLPWSCFACWLSTISRKAPRPSTWSSGNSSVCATRMLTKNIELLIAASSGYYSGPIDLDFISAQGPTSAGLAARHCVSLTAPEYIPTQARIPRIRVVFSRGPTSTRPLSQL